MRKIFFALLTLTLISCNNEKPKVDEKKEEIEVLKKLTVELKFKTNKEDTFKLMLNNIYTDDFQSKNIVISEKVSPTSDIDNLVANFGENISNNLNINFGNKEVKEIQIELIKIEYGEEEINIMPTELKEYFVLNKFVELDTTNNKLLTKKIENRHSPTIFLKKKILLNLQNSISKE